MRPLTLQQVRHATGGSPLTPPPESMPTIVSVSTDTRTPAPNSLFIALRGKNFDGHTYLKQAAAAGAVAAIVDRAPDSPVPNLSLIGVKDTYAAMGRLANFIRKQLRGKVIAVAGSNGKTGTKHLIHSAIGSRLRGSISPASYNNNVGVPLTIFQADPSADYLVTELGTNNPGEIRQLTRIVQPDIAVITNCGAEHLQGLGDLIGVRRENSTVVEGLPPTGCLVVHGDDPELLTALAGYKGRRLTFGLARTNDLFAADVTATNRGVSFRLNDSRNEVFLPLLGRHVATNALAAIAVARLLKLDERTIIANLANAKAPPMRLELITAGDVTILNDAYNANPDSTRAALQTVADLRALGRRVAVLADMLELGDASARYHAQIGQAAANSKLDQLICVGAMAATIANAAITAGFNAQSIRQFPDASAAAAALADWLTSNDLVLLKGSRGMHLEIIATVISRARGGAAGASAPRQTQAAAS